VNHRYTVGLSWETSAAPSDHETVVRGMVAALLSGAIAVLVNEHLDSGEQQQREFFVEGAPEAASAALRLAELEEF
jgi:hypothetical protein